MSAAQRFFTFMQERETMQKPVSSMPHGIEALIRAYMRRRPACMLCKGPYQKVLILLPGALIPLELSNKQVGCMFALCKHCLELKGVEVRVMAALQRDRREQEAVLWD